MTENDFEYQELPDGSVRITGMKDRCEELVIPERLGGKKVTEIGPMAFSGWKELRRITLPEGLLKICHNAFSGCENLDKVFLPDGLTELGDFAFNNCTGMSYIRIPASLTKVGLKALPGTVLILPPYSPLAARYPKNRYVYWDEKESLEKLEERISARRKEQKRTAGLAIGLFSLFALFGVVMLAGLFLKNTKVLTIGWIGTALFGIILLIRVRMDQKKKSR